MKRFALLLIIVTLGIVSAAQFRYRYASGYVYLEPEGSEDEPAGGATVRRYGTTDVTVTDVNGYFRLFFLEHLEPVIPSS